MKINRKLLPMKLHYFLLYGGLSPMSPFVPTIVKDLGFSAFVVGTMYTVVPLLTILGQPLLGGIADKFQCQKAMFLTLLIIQALFFFIIQWMPSLPSTTTYIECGNETNLNICSLTIKDINDPQQLFYNGNDSYCQLSCDQLIGFHSSMNSSEMQHLQNVFTTPFNKTIALDQEHNFALEAMISSDISKKDNDCLNLKVNWIASDGPHWFKPWCESPITSSCKVICENEILSEIINAQTGVPDSDIIYYYQFWLILLVIAVAKITSVSVASIGDAMCFNLLGDKPTNFGLQRLWGAAGWGLVALISGLIVDKFSEGSSHKHYTVAFNMGLVILFLDLLLSFKLEYKNIAPPPSSMVKDLLKVMANFQVFIFMVWCTLIGVYTAMIWNFLFWFLEDVAAKNGFGEMTYIKTLEGLVLAFHCYLGEIPFFFFSGWIIKKLGHKNTMTLVLAAFGLRFIIYSYLTNPWWTLPAEALNGITFGIYFATMTTYASSIAPPGTEATVQNLVQALYDGLGVSFGSFFGGYMIQVFGGSQTFWILGLSAVLFAILHTVLQYFIIPISSTDKSVNETPQEKIPEKF